MGLISIPIFLRHPRDHGKRKTGKKIGIDIGLFLYLYISTSFPRYKKLSISILIFFSTKLVSGSKVEKKNDLIR